MKYPIFDSIVNQIEAILEKKNIKVLRFKKWNEEIINATGLEIEIELSDASTRVTKAVINMDWDRFREANLAAQLEGMEKHPLNNMKSESESYVTPSIDVEVIWHFEQEAILDYIDNPVGNNRINAASKWMEEVNKHSYKINLSDNLVTRWHIEIGGDLQGKFLSAMCLISYMQYKLENEKTLNDIHELVGKKVQEILMRTNRVIQIADKTLPSIAA